MSDTAFRPQPPAASPRTWLIVALSAAAALLGAGAATAYTRLTASPPAVEHPATDAQPGPADPGFYPVKLGGVNVKTQAARLRLPTRGR